jgi:hypothetical protein
MKPVQLLALLFAAGCAQAPAQNNLAVQNNQAAAPGQALQPDPVMRPDVTREALMDRIERDVRLPRGAGPLASYVRSYAWQQRGDGVRKVAAVYVSDGIAQQAKMAPGRHWLAPDMLPLIMDGGCAIISLSYDVATQRIEHVTCNGDA